MTVIQCTEYLNSWANELGFSHIGVTTHTGEETEQHLHQWLDKGFAADLDYMSKHGTKRTRPQELEPWTRSIIVVSFPYLLDGDEPLTVLNSPDKAYISRYCHGRDYHKVIKKRLSLLIAKMKDSYGEFQSRAFVDSAPVMERALARNAGIGWIGKNSMLMHRSGGSFSFLGVVYTDLDLVSSELIASHCGSCTACITHCPTQAIVAPYTVDARRCISYLTIENKGAIPLEFRKALGNRIFGCDDCQLYCPWNRFAQYSSETDFAVRNSFDQPDLLELFFWSEQEFLDNTQGMAVRRTGYQGWLRNIATALGNAPESLAIVEALRSRLATSSELVREHIVWALSEQGAGADS